MLLAARANLGPMNPPGDPPFGYYGAPVDDPSIIHQLGLDLLGPDMSAPDELLSTGQSHALNSFFQSLSGPNLGVLNFGEGGEGDLHDFGFQGTLAHEQALPGMFEWDIGLEPRPHRSEVQTFPSLNQQPSRDDIEAARTLSRPRSAHATTHNGLQFGPTHEVPTQLNHDASFMLNPAPAQSYSRLPGDSLPAPGLQFGTDSNFSGAVHYVPPQIRDQADHFAAQQLATLMCLKKDPSATPTRATSPVHWAAEHAAPKPETASPLKLQIGNIPPASAFEEADEPSLRSAKRRKSCRSTTLEADDDQLPSSAIGVAPSTGLPSPASSAHPTVPTTLPKRRKQQQNASLGEEPAASNGKRKRQAAATPKPPRENLSSSQKRHNHIRSEQKRRNVIKIGFEQLNRVVPALRNNGLSKAMVLKEAALWIEEIEKGNKMLQDMLDQSQEEQE